MYLGIDAGGSKTHAVLTNNKGELIGQGMTGNGNHQVKYEEAKVNIVKACNLALQAAGAVKEDVAFAYFGLAGADREPDYKILRPLIESIGFPAYSLTCDTMIAMRAGTKRAYGAVVISGTGFNSAARNKHGEELQYGGFGYLYGDGQGAGADLSVHAFRSAVRAWDGREQRPTLLSSLVPEHLGYATVEQMYHHMLDHQIYPPLELAKLVFEAAERGDEVAISILKEAGDEHGNAVNALIRRLNMQAEAFDVVLAGSVLTKGKTLHMVRAIEDAVTRIAPRASIVKLDVEPVIGAVMSAMEGGGAVITAEIDAALRAIKFE